MAYIDIFVAPVPTANREQYKKHCDIAAKLFKEYGAQDVVQCWGDDVPDGKITSFPMAVKLEEGETVSAGWLIWPDKATRDAGMAKMMEDPRMQPDVNPMGFDGQRMIFGGFKIILEP
ncbi:RNA signal recognition particle [Pseudomonas sp. MYb2]|uniref:DUF1428 domain-containing protein n=1 Tax=unclassified Pseudomonas TaxID=196821 RepID=UPI000CFF0F20|nr:MULTISPECIES: DUF1428 domain-containing protein [unclassified Pseudomonas]PRB50024.1 RNA signal recognition particle [Pseudomonas sp. MYb3]PRC36662.1 RNA signal recognition particle [Pseudomonas sp. MYb2]